MLSALSLRRFSPVENWRSFAALLVVLVLARGVALMCVMPPLEGWDEYQHLAYMQHLVDGGGRPVLGSAVVPRELLRATVAFPQPDFMVEQTQTTGSLGYGAYFASDKLPQYRSDHPDVSLYQAQHSQLYYQLLRPLYAAAGGLDRLAATTAALRFTNLAFTVGALCLMLLFLGRFGRTCVHTGMLAMLCCCQPLYLLNGCRVTNDALAVLLGTIVCLWALIPSCHGRLLPALVVGLSLGGAILAKSTSMALIPFIPFCVAMSVWKHGETLKRGCVAVGVVLGTATLVALPVFVFNIRHYGVLTPMQEALITSRNGQGVTDFVRAAWEINILRRMGKLWLKHSTWVGGWSFLKTPHIRNGISVLLAAGALGWSFGIARLRSRYQDRCYRLSDVSIRCVALITCVSLGLGWHMIHSYLAWYPNGPSTNSWYACLTFPFALMMVTEGIGRWRRPMPALLLFALLACYLFAEWYGLLVAMPRCYSGGLSGLAALARISQLQPSYLGTTTFCVAAVAMAVLTLVCLGGAIVECVGKPKPKPEPEPCES